MKLSSRLVLGLLTMVVIFAMASVSFAQVQLTIITDPSAQEVATNRNSNTASPGVVGDGITISGSVVGTTSLTSTILKLSFPGPITSSPANNATSTFNCVMTATSGGVTWGNTTNVIYTACGTPVGGGATDATGVPMEDPIAIVGGSGLFAGAVSVYLNTSTNAVWVFLPTGTVSSASSGNFIVKGTRIDANGKTGAQTVTATLDSGANGYVLLTTSATVVNGFSAGLGNFALGVRNGSALTAGAATVFTNKTVARQTGTLLLSEGFASAWRTGAQSSNSSTALPNGTRIRLTFSGLPTGVTLSLTTNVSGTSTATASVTGTATGVGGAGTGSVTAVANTAYVDFLTTNLTSTESLEVDVSLSSGTALGSTANVSTPGTITVSATMFPFGDGVTTSGSKLNAPREDQGYPAFVEADLGPVTIVNIVPANSTMLMPLAEKIASIGFDTGISIANTTADPFGAAGGGATSVSTNATVTMYFFPNNLGTAFTGSNAAGASCSFTSSATNHPGTGMNNDGTVPAGATWVVLLSSILPLSNCAAGDFQGYIFVVPNFPDAHGEATITDFRTFSLAANVLILPSPAATPRPAGENLNN